MRLGIIARADNGGLGAQTFEQYRHLEPTKTMVVDISNLNGFPTHYRRYPDATIIKGFPTPQDFEEFIKDLDVVLTTEIPYGYQLFDICRRAGVKTALQYNYEFLDYLQTPNLPAPDLLLAPSVWHLEEVRHLAEKIGSKLVHLEVPVNRDVIPFRLRTEAKTFLHIAGHKTYKDRNGTEIVLEAMRYVKSDVKLIITAQGQDIVSDDPRVEIVHKDFENYWDIWNEIDADVLLLPRRYGGLSLQLNEAQASGMPVLMSNLEPQSTFLPDAELLPYHRLETILTRTEIESASVDPARLASQMDVLAQFPKIVAELSTDSNHRANEISWAKLAPTYITELRSLC